MKTFKVVKEGFAMGGQVYPVGSTFQSSGSGITSTGCYFGQLEEVKNPEPHPSEGNPRLYAENILAEAATKKGKPLTPGEINDIATHKDCPPEVALALMDIADTLGKTGKQTSNPEDK